MTEPPDDPQLKVGTTGFVVLADDEGAIVPTELVYRPDDCLAARLVLLGPEGLEVGWTFAWELLARGLLSPAGEGDVTVRPARGPIDSVEVSLVAQSTARIWLPGDGVAEFVRKVRGRAGLDVRGIVPALDKELATITNGT
ncbi:Streptomyces sporulation and cell division protein, SsgA [Streptomyces sp. 3213]|uniref:SsgA family sporulation/cell division regulator n=1 Tax=Streptomyces sp. 3213.3 TaxID=1855348 RepID=UPI0008954050|nr:SsgA family sporulation/cell division regulator [Streptomyces sp. 3213.3]SEE52570.1 Streptomyces sporulation and cell division protein, SsgA [Streptomyces sp. 3213] [Streptomyces sp. 3213.3]